ncbi:MAG: hypothetical protein H0V05_19885 [Euzebyaceae bacterium]|nr:hypothetical protein [Euzebyaceae bacterium]
MSDARGTRGFDPEEIIRVLARHGVRYVLVGGVAARLHGSPTLTEDVDVTPERSADNLGRLAAALGDLSARLAVPDVDEGLAIPLDERTFNAPVMKFTTRAGEVDVVLETLAAGDYAVLAPRAVTYEVFGLRLAVASLDDIIASKAASDRPKDRAHLPVLRQLARELASPRDAAGETHRY